MHRAFLLFLCLRCASNWGISECRNGSRLELLSRPFTLGCQLQCTVLRRFWDWTPIVKPRTTRILLTFGRSDVWFMSYFVGTELFLSEGQVSRYYFGKWSFTIDILQGLLPPTGDLGISRLKSMLIIQPEDRPTVVGALSHRWWVGLKRNTEDSGENGDGTTQSRNESTLSRKRKKTFVVMKSRYK